MDYFVKIAKIISRKSGLMFTFVRAQLSSQISSITDFSVTFLVNRFFENVLFRFFGEYGYVFATGFGAVCGGVVNCIINYKWTFKAEGVARRYVVIKFILVWIGSLLLNMSGTYLLTEYLKDAQWVHDLLGHFIDDIFMIPKLIVSLLVGFLWNFNMQRLFVYRDINIKGFFKKHLKHNVDEEGKR